VRHPDCSGQRETSNLRKKATGVIAPSPNRVITETTMMTANPHDNNAQLTAEISMGGRSDVPVGVRRKSATARGERKRKPGPATRCGGGAGGVPRA
jgi:hypothetical protein